MCVQIQYWGLQARFSLLYLCVSEESAGQMSGWEHALCCLRQMFIGIRSSGGRRETAAASRVAAQRKEGVSYRLPLRRVRTSVANRGSQLNGHDVPPDQYTSSDGDHTIEVRTASSFEHLLPTH